MLRSIHDGGLRGFKATRWGVLAMALIGLALWGAREAHAAPARKGTPRPASEKAATRQAKADAEAPVSVAGKGVSELQTGRARIERLETIFTDGAGPYVAAEAGDWRLSNEFVTLTFASVDAKPPKVSQPIGGLRGDKGPSSGRAPGALIDVAVEGGIFDTLVTLTQGIGANDLNGPVMPYDTARPVKRGNEVGLRLEGSPFESTPIRVRTTYWLAAGSHRVRIETAWVGLPDGEAAPALSDLGRWGAGAFLVEGHGIAGAPRGQHLAGKAYLEQAGDLCMGLAPLAGVAEGLFFSDPPVSRVIYHPELKKEDKNTTGSAAKRIHADDTATTATPKTLVRDLWLARGNYADVTRQILADRKIPSGAVSGQVTTGSTKKPDPNVIVSFQRMDPERAGMTQPPLYTIANVDPQGRYKVELPLGRYFVHPDSKIMTGGTRLMVDCKIEAGKPKVKDLQAFPESGVRVKVIDARTSKPLAAHLYFEPVKDVASPLDFGFPFSARQYMQFAYIPPQETQISLPSGRWMVYATHGLRYERGEVEVRVSREKVSNCTLALHEESPSPGWVGVEIGARTKATPGCLIDPSDMVLMAVGEGLEWIVSGDFNCVTDFGPTIKKMGLTSLLGSSRGFRTLSTTHPEWGQFLIYPLAANAPDPVQAHRTWDRLGTAPQFIATLRRFYPGALIQSEQPYLENQDGQGYFAIAGQNVYQIAYQPNPKIDLSIDAVNLLPARRPWNLTHALGFMYSHMIQGRFYLPSTSATGRSILGGEPGYPRLLVLVGKTSAVELSEEALFKAIRAHKIELSSGPFIDFSVAGVAPGGLTGLNLNAKVNLRITAPTWIDTDFFAIDKEGIQQHESNFGSDVVQPQRYPEPDGEAGMALGALRPVKDKDTLLGVTVAGRKSLKQMLPAVQPAEETMPLAFTYPIVIDANGNKKFDPFKSFGDLGR